MEPVGIGEVARSWLHRERRKPYRDVTFEGAEEEWELVGKLLCQCPFQAAFVWRHHVSWVRTELTRDEFRRLRVIDGPEDESWRKLAPSREIREAAERIERDALSGTYEDVDVDCIRRKAATFPVESEEHLVLFQPDPTEPPYVVDGNHYATAKALSLLDGGRYVPQPVYLGVKRDCQPVDPDGSPPGGRTTTGP